MARGQWQRDRGLGDAVLRDVQLRDAAEIGDEGPDISSQAVGGQLSVPGNSNQKNDSNNFFIKHCFKHSLHLQDRGCERERGRECESECESECA